MRSDGPEHGSVFVVNDIGLTAGFLYQATDRGIMDMADPWEQVMFDLKIQPTQKPIQRLARGGKICGRFDLVNGPFLFDFFFFGMGGMKLRDFYYVCQLKYDTDNKAGGECDDEKPDNPRNPSNHEDG